jgi:hypothetical protein
MKQVGTRLTEIAGGNILPEQTRARLAERAVFRALLDLETKKSQSIKWADLQQMLRNGGDRIRADSARAVGTFLDSGQDQVSTREDRFRKVVKPFLDNAWPKELNLTSRQLSNALAELPAKCGSAFSEGVDLLERYLTPFDCWGMYEFGVHSSAEDHSFSLTKDAPTGEALLRLLDHAIGVEEHAVFPNDLGKGLEFIKECDPSRVRDSRYKRLAALLRGLT